MQSGHRLPDILAFTWAQLLFFSEAAMQGQKQRVRNLALAVRIGNAEANSYEHAMEALG